MTSPPEPLVLIQNEFTEMFTMVPWYQNCANGSFLLDERAARALDKKCFKMTSPLEPLVLIQNKFTEMFPMIPWYQNCTNGSALLNERAARALDKSIFKWYILNHWSKFKIISKNCSSCCPLQNFYNGSALPNKGATRALDNKCL